MASPKEIFKELFAEVQAVLAPGSASRDAVDDVLAEGSLYAKAQQIIDGDRQNLKLTQASGDDLWAALTESISAALRGGGPDPSAAARSAFVQQLKTLGAEADREWLAAVPVRADLSSDLVIDLGTAKQARVLLATEFGEGQREARWDEACDVLGCPRDATRELKEVVHPSPLFLCVATGPLDHASRQVMRSVAVARDALRYARHALSQQPSPGPIRSESVQSLVVVYRVAGLADGVVSEHTARHADVWLDDVGLLKNPRGRELYDVAARVMEIYPEDAPDAEQKTLGGRLARSIRAFSRAVSQQNRDLRYLLLMVAFEALLNSKDAPISDALAEYGALLTVSTVDDRVKVSRELKEAYNLRSRFVHDGKLPTEQLADEDYAKTEALVYATLLKLMAQLLPLGERGWADKVYMEKLLRLKFGASWAEASADRGV